jgi:hypothetical protein
MNISPNAQKWRQLDQDTAFDTNGEVHHGESIKQNLRSLGEDTLHAVLPFDRAIMTSTSLSRYGAGGAVMGFFIGLGQDLLEVVSLPYIAVKTLLDVGAHGVAMAVTRAPKQAAPVPGFDFTHDASAVRLLKHKSGLVDSTDPQSRKNGTTT